MQWSWTVSGNKECTPSLHEIVNKLTRNFKTDFIYVTWKYRYLNFKNDCEVYLQNVFQ